MNPYVFVLSFSPARRSLRLRRIYKLVFTLTMKLLSCDISYQQLCQQVIRSGISKGCIILHFK